MVRRVYHRNCGGKIVQRTTVSAGAIVKKDPPYGKIIEDEEPLGEQEVVNREFVCEDCNAVVRNVEAVEVIEHRDGKENKVLDYKFMEGF